MVTFVSISQLLFSTVSIMVWASISANTSSGLTETITSDGVWRIRRRERFVLLQPNFSLFKQIRSTETMSRCSRAPPKRKNADPEKYNRSPVIEVIKNEASGHGDIISREFLEWRLGREANEADVAATKARLTDSAKQESS